MPKQEIKVDKCELTEKTPKKASYRRLDIPDLVFEVILEERKKYEARRTLRFLCKNAKILSSLK